MFVAVGLAVSVAGAPGCAASDTFECQADSECTNRLFPSGTCEPSGFCSFPDLGCPGTERKYGDFSGPLSGECVPPPGATGSDGSSGSPPGGSTTDDGGSTTAGPMGSTGSGSGSSSGGDTEGPMSETTEAGPTSSYGPCDEMMGCAEAEAVCLTAGEGQWCAPPCTGMGNPCPDSEEVDLPTGCVMKMDGATYCALVCSPMDECPMGMQCDFSGGTPGICVWPTMP